MTDGVAARIVTIGSRIAARRLGASSAMKIAPRSANGKDRISAPPVVSSVPRIAGQALSVVDGSPVSGSPRNELPSWTSSGSSPVPNQARPLAEKDGQPV